MIRLAVRVRREHAELALAELLELAPAGVEETDLGEVVEYAVYGPPGELPELPALQAATGEALVEVVTTEVADDWADRWRSFHRAIVVRGERGGLEVRPPWDPGGAEEGTESLVIDPGQAFGTGAHHTTRMCLELMLGMEPSGSLADLGCGSGVLAIAAMRLGWASVVAVDNDAASVEATRANAAANGVELEARRLDLRRERPPAADVLVANLVGPLLRELAAAIAGAGAHTLIVSGLLASEADDISEAYAARGYAEQRRLHSGEWAALTLAASS